MSDVLQLEDDRLKLVDYMNLKLKLFDLNNYECTDFLVCPGKPWNVCHFLTNDGAVTIPHRKKIQIINISGKMRKVREFRTRLDCYGIIMAANLLAVTTGKDQHCILILDKNGTEIRTIRETSYESESLFGPMRIATNASKTVLYVSYHNGNMLVAYNSSWDALFTYTDPEMQGPAGVDTDKDGNIYLCGYNSD
ncbi:hypothetical protein ACJMK2_000297 [Sinanodonta woodiana]|uniref:Uncharacterized protein n=1 Tax=Sinanodonta woodiana TaxID=1069815 RepID=A0ABD3XNT9_SINWO